jgi:hypothetical protein
MGVFVCELPDLFELPQDLPPGRLSPENLARGMRAGFAQNAFAVHARVLNRNRGRFNPRNPAASLSWILHRTVIVRTKMQNSPAEPALH